MLWSVGGYGDAAIGDARDRFREFLLGRDLSDRTVQIYVGRWDQARRWCADNGRRLDRLSASETRRMGDELWPYTHSTRRQGRLALKYYWELVGREDGGPFRAVRMPKKPRGRNRAMSRGDARRLVEVAFGWYQPGVAVLVGLYMGLRAAEIASLRWDRFDPDLAWYTVLGKGGVTATIPVHPRLRDELVVWRTGALYLFPGARGRAHVTGTTVGIWCEQVCERAGVGRVTPHVLRHTAITELNDRTGDLRAAQQFARHARPETTALYTRVDSARLMSAVEAMDYLGEGDA